MAGQALSERLELLSEIARWLGEGEMEPAGVLPTTADPGQDQRWHHAQRTASCRGLRLPGDLEAPISAFVSYNRHHHESMKHSTLATLLRAGPASCGPRQVKRRPSCIGA